MFQGENGSALKATTLLARLNWLSVNPAYSRPCMNDDSPYAESLFCISKGFTDPDVAPAWDADFVSWHNLGQRHSGIQYVSSSQRHEGEN